MKFQDYQKYSNAVCTNNFKSAALYFDKVLPLYLGSMRGDSKAKDMMIGFPEEIPSRVLINLIDKKTTEENSYVHADRIFDVVCEVWTNFAKKISPYGNPFLSEEFHTYTKNDYEKVRLLNNYRKIIDAYLNDAKVDGAEPIRKLFKQYAISVGFDNFDVLQFNTERDISKPFSDPSVTLTNLNLIDTQNSDWKQIVEIRKDENSHRKLKRLRLFLVKNYDGCSISYIEDDLSLQIYEYEETCKKFGFNTITSNLSLLLDSNNLQTTIGASLLASILGGPLSGLAVGTTIEIGKLAINYSEKSHELRNWKNGHDLAYIFDTKEKLK